MTSKFDADTRPDSLYQKRASLMWRPLFEQIRSELLEGAEGLCFAPSREMTLRQRVCGTL
jgi:hypothetical protein